MNPEMDASNEIHVALAADTRYLPGLELTAASMAVRASPGVRLCFHILDGGIDDSDFAAFAGLMKCLRPDNAVVRHRLAETRDRDFRDVYGKRMTYKRLLLPAVLSDLDFVVYCDVDFLWLGDVAELWALRNPKLFFQSTHDRAPETIDHESSWFAARGVPFDAERYFCAGLLLMNLRKLRDEDVMARVFAFLDEHPDVNLADQSALNAVVQEKTGFVPQRWQVFSRDVVFGRDAEKPAAIHYAGELPWLRWSRLDMLTDTILFWHRVNAAMRGLSLWGALLLHFRADEIVVRRTLFLFAASPLTSWLFKLLLVLSGRKGYGRRFGMWWRRVRMPDASKFFTP